MGKTFPRSDFCPVRLSETSLYLCAHSPQPGQRSRKCKEERSGVDRVHICRNRCNRRLRKIFVDCVNFSVNNANCEQNLSHILRTYCDHISDIGKEALIHWNGPPIAKAQKLGEAALDRVFGGRNRSPLEPSTSCFTLTHTSQVELCHKSK